MLSGMSFAEAWSLSTSSNALSCFVGGSCSEELGAGEELAAEVVEGFGVNPDADIASTVPPGMEQYG